MHHFFLHHLFANTCLLTSYASSHNLFPYSFHTPSAVFSLYALLPHTIYFLTPSVSPHYFLTPSISSHNIFPYTIYFLTPSVSSQKLFPYIVSSHHLFSYTICFLPHPLFATLNCMNISFISVTPISPFQSL